MAATDPLPLVVAAFSGLLLMAVSILTDEIFGRIVRIVLGIVGCGLLLLGMIAL